MEELTCNDIKDCLDNTIKLYRESNDIVLIGHELRDLYVRMFTKKLGSVIGAYGPADLELKLLDAVNYCLNVNYNAKERDHVVTDKIYELNCLLDSMMISYLTDTSSNDVLALVKSL